MSACYQSVFGQQLFERSSLSVHPKPILMRITWKPIACIGTKHLNVFFGEFFSVNCKHYSLPFLFLRRYIHFCLQLKFCVFNEIKIYTQLVIVVRNNSDTILSFLTQISTQLSYIISDFFPYALCSLDPFDLHFVFFYLCMIQFQFQLCILLYSINDNCLFLAITY